MRSTRRRDRERRATGIFSSAVGSRRGRASGWKRLARRKPRRSAVRSRAWASRASDPRARLRRIRRKRLNIAASGARHTARNSDANEATGGTPPSRPARRTSAPLARRRGRRLSARAAEERGASGTAQRGASDTSALRVSDGPFWRSRFFERRRLFFNGVDRVRPRRPTRRVASRCDGYSKNGIGIAAGRGGSRAGRAPRPSRDDSVSKKASRKTRARRRRASLDRAAASLASSSSKSSFENLRGGLSGGSGGSGGSRARLASGSTRIAGASFANDPSPTVSAVARRRDAAPTSMYSASRCAGTATLAGGVNGVAKENQDSFFIVPGGEAKNNRKNAGDFALGVLDGHGADGRRVSKFIAAKIKACLERYFASSIVASSSAESSSALDALEDAVVAAFAEAGRRSAPRRGEASSTRSPGARASWSPGAARRCSPPTSGTAAPCFAARRTLGAVSGLPLCKTRALSSFLTCPRTTSRIAPTSARGSSARAWGASSARARLLRVRGAAPRVAQVDAAKRGSPCLGRSGDTRLARAGVTPTPEITVTDIRHPGTHGVDAPLCVVLASDGVWDHVSSAARRRRRRRGVWVARTETEDDRWWNVARGGRVRAYERSV